MHQQMTEGECVTLDLTRYYFHKILSRALLPPLRGPPPSRREANLHVSLLYRNEIFLNRSLSFYKINRVLQHSFFILLFSEQLRR